MNKKIALTFNILFFLIILLVGRSFAEHESKEIQHNIELLFENNSCIKCNLQGANLNRAELANADLSGAILRSATFFLANLTGANFQNCDLRESEFGGSDISEADFRGANITTTSFSGAYKRGATFGEKIQDKKSSKAAIKEVRKNDGSNVIITNKNKDKESGLTVQPDIINSRKVLPTSSYGPPLKKITPIPKAIFNSK